MLLYSPCNIPSCWKSLDRAYFLLDYALFARVCAARRFHPVAKDHEARSTLQLMPTFGRCLEYTLETRTLLGHDDRLFSCEFFARLMWSFPKTCIKAPGLRDTCNAFMHAFNRHRHQRENSVCCRRCAWANSEPSHPSRLFCPRVPNPVLMTDPRPCDNVRLASDLNTSSWPCLLWLHYSQAVTRFSRTPKQTLAGMLFYGHPTSLPSFVPQGLLITRSLHPAFMGARYEHSNNTAEDDSPRVCASSTTLQFYSLRWRHPLLHRWLPG